MPTFLKIAAFRLPMINHLEAKIPGAASFTVASSCFVTRTAVTLTVVIAAVACFAVDIVHGQQATPAFQVRLSESIADHPVSGRIFVMMSKRASPEPRLGPSWFNPEPFFGKDVLDLKPGIGSLVIDAASEACPMALSQVPEGEYFVQALLHLNRNSPSPGKATGNLFSDIQQIDFDPKNTHSIELLLSNTVVEQGFEETEKIRHIGFRSDLLSEFHGRPVDHIAAVVLPNSHDERPQRKYPIVFEVAGFGGTIHDMARKHRKKVFQRENSDERKTDNAETSGDDVEFIRVLLDGQCEWGHHVYANSATNGPRGDALVLELIPFLEEQFRAVPDPRARFLTGHSSGGWSSLWLQVRYPEHFGGVWSVAPDPVDFRDWQQVNLYAKPLQSLYTDGEGSRRPLARDNAKTLIWYDDFALLDDTLKRGGQLRSFEAVFSPLNESGEPMKMWDRKTGRVRPETVEAWKKYDIRLLLEDNWPQLRDTLAGKIHITMGDQDTFFLDGATRLLGETLQQLGSDAQVNMIPGANHFSVVSPRRLESQRAQMTERYLQFFDASGRPEQR